MCAQVYIYFYWKLVCKIFIDAIIICKLFGYLNQEKINYITRYKYELIEE